MAEDCKLYIYWGETINTTNYFSFVPELHFEKEFILPIDEVTTSIQIQMNRNCILVLDELWMNNTVNILSNSIEGNFSQNMKSSFLFNSEDSPHYLTIPIPSTKSPVSIYLKGYCIPPDSSLYTIMESGLNTSNTSLKNSVSYLSDFDNNKIDEPKTKAGYLLRDIGYGFELLLREGLWSFFKRIYWYSRGKRLIEDIYAYKINKSISHKPGKNPEVPITFVYSEDPQISIIIPVYNQWNYTYNCLKSIYENTSDVSYEIIIADDCSTDKTSDIQNIIQNISVIRNAENLHFLKNCNHAAKSAKGKYILFLNNDTTVHPKWLSSLLEVMEKDPAVGAVGSKLIYPDGTLQEAGGIIWNDASGWNYGKFREAHLPEFNYLKEVDYASGACLLVRKTIWDEMGGFDERFVPAYYEDTDLAFTLRKMGYKVMYQPASVVTHFEGISHGTKVSEGVKRFQEDNRMKFFEKWKTVLEVEHAANGSNVFTARERSSKKQQILVIDHYVPHYDKDAGSRSTFSYIKLLLKMGFNVKFIGDNYFKHEPYTTTLEQLGVEVLYGTYYQRNIHRWIKENGMYFDFVFLHRMHIAPKYLDSLKRYTTAKLVYVGHDLNFLSSLRKYEVTANKEFLQESSKFKTIEKYIFDTTDIILPFSTYEAPFIKELAPTKVVETVPVFFYNNIPDNVNTFENRKDLLFVGGFGHPPNIDSVLWFIHDIFPLIQQNIEGIKIYIVGSKPTKEIVDLANDSVIVTGFVTDEELEHYYSECRVAVLPLRYGAGVKGKLLEACYYQIPTVITPVTAEGIPSIEEYAFIANSSEIFASYTVELYKNNLLWQQQSSKSKKLIEENYTENAAQEILKNILIKQF